MPVTNLTLFNQLLGPLSTDAEVQAYTLSVPQSPGVDGNGVSTDGAGSGFILRRNLHWTRLWNLLGDGSSLTTDNMLFANFYDRAHVGYAMYAMGGYADETLLSQANAIALTYRNYLNTGSNYLISPHYQMLRGISLHYAATGSTTSRATVAQVADQNLGIPYTSGFARSVGRLWLEDIQANGGWWDQRIWARTGESMIQAYVIGAPSVGNPSFPAGGNNYLVRSQEWLDKILNNSAHHQSWIGGVLTNGVSDGLWRSADALKILTGFGTSTMADDTYDPNTIYVRPFFLGLILYALMDYYRFIAQDARIVPAILAACEAMWTGTRAPGCSALWVPGPSINGVYNGMSYLEAPSFSGFPGSDGPEQAFVAASADLNGLYLAPHAFLYKHTGDATWRTRFDLILDGTKQSQASTTTNGKQYQETFSYTQNMWPMILGTPASGGGTMTSTDTKDAVNVVGRVGTSIRLNWV